MPFVVCQPFCESANELGSHTKAPSLDVETWHPRVVLLGLSMICVAEREHRLGSP